MTKAHFSFWIFFSLLASVFARAEAIDDSILLRSGAIAVTNADLQLEFLVLTEDERARVLADSAALKQFLRRIYQDKNMVATAERLNLEQAPHVQARLALERRRVLAEALREHAREEIGVPDFAALAREHYAAQRATFHLPEQFKARHILKRVQCDCERDPQRQATEQVLARLHAGEDFATLAKTESEDARSAAQGGDLGAWLKAEDLVPPFVDALKELPVGELSDVVETEYGFHIIKKLDEQPARQQNFEEVQAGIENSLKLNYVNNLLMRKALEYLPPQDAEFDEEALQALLGRAPEPSNPAPSNPAPSP